MKEICDHFEITALPQNAGLAREHIRKIAEQSGFSHTQLADIEIATGEAVTNAILYGSPSAESRIHISCGFADGHFCIEVRDQGRGFDPTRVPDDADMDALGGRGLRLMRALMDQVDLHYDGRGMLARLTKTKTS